ncbi:MAG TPA: class I SAM-dependent methyltransferase, partial [Ktedonobacterales bacterium]
DRALLDCFAESVDGRGVVADLGCGPGHVGRYLSRQGIPTLGVDLAPEMVAIARRLTPAMTFLQGDMRALTAPNEAWCGITAFYSLIHFSPRELPEALAECYRVLAHEGLLLLALHLGEDELIHNDELWGIPIQLDLYLYRVETVTDILRAVGFTLEASVIRAPYPPAVEHQSQRAYLLARKP